MWAKDGRGRREVSGYSASAASAATARRCAGRCGLAKAVDRTERSGSLARRCKSAGSEVWLATASRTVTSGSEANRLRRLSSPLLAIVVRVSGPSRGSQPLRTRARADEERISRRSSVGLTSKRPATWSMLAQCLYNDHGQDREGVRIDEQQGPRSVSVGYHLRALS